jgi:ribosomal protein S12 methylthiotransferase
MSELRRIPVPAVSDSIVVAPGAAPKVGFVSLGCPKALVDSEQILTQLRAEGYETA